MSTEHMKAAAEALHRIASSNRAKRILAKPGKLTEPMIASMRAKVMTDEEIDRLALDQFEALAMAMAGENDNTTTDHPWQVYLHHRARTLDWMRKQGKTPEEMVRELAMDPGQVRLILMTVDDYPEDYAVTSPVPIVGAKALRSSHDRGKP